MGKSLLVADRCRSGVPVLPTEVVGFASSGESGLTFCLRLGAVLRSRSVIKSRVSRVKIRSARARFGFHCAAAERV